MSHQQLFAHEFRRNVVGHHRYFFDQADVGTQAQNQGNIQDDHQGGENFGEEKEVFEKR